MSFVGHGCIMVCMNDETVNAGRKESEKSPACGTKVSLSITMKNTDLFKQVLSDCTIQIAGECNSLHLRDAAAHRAMNSLQTEYAFNASLHLVAAALNLLFAEKNINVGCYVVSHAHVVVETTSGTKAEAEKIRSAILWFINGK